MNTAWLLYMVADNRNEGHELSFRAINTILLDNKPLFLGFAKNQPRFEASRRRTGKSDPRICILAQNNPIHCLHTRLLQQAGTYHPAMKDRHVDAPGPHKDMFWPPTTSSIGQSSQPEPGRTIIVIPYGNLGDKPSGYFLPDKGHTKHTTSLHQIPNKVQKESEKNPIIHTWRTTQWNTCFQSLWHKSQDKAPTHENSCRGAHSNRVWVSGTETPFLTPGSSFHENLTKHVQKRWLIGITGAQHAFLP
jgi:hypothetical protein